jgi:hypothetical protein
MKGYYTDTVYMGYIPTENKYLQFESERAYTEYFRSIKEDL